MSIWYRLDESYLSFHPHIKIDDKCAYAREYKTQKGFKASKTNSFIFNLKKSPKKKETLEWHHRILAVKTFAKELSQLFKPSTTATITAVPSSKPKTHPEYDNRFEDVFTELLKVRPLLNIEWPIEIENTMQSSHLGGSRNPQDIKKNYIWKGLKSSTKKIGILDDVLTTGAHFRAMSDFLRENGYKGEIVGIFWSRAVFPS